MTPLCPKCREPTLVALSATRASPFDADNHHSPPSRCKHCHGVWLPPEALHESVVPPAVAAEVPVETSSDTDGRAGFCPNGHGFLIRARVEQAHPFYLDRCGMCAGIWFDAGEWATIASSQWLQHLDDLWDPVYRRKMREERAHEHHLETLHHALGDEAYEKVLAAAAVLRHHPMKSLALAYILDETRTHLSDT
jgi:Zn-finger nucleic acid-binding protein